MGNGVATCYFVGLGVALGSDFIARQRGKTRSPNCGVKVRISPNPESPKAQAKLNFTSSKLAILKP